MQENSPRDCLGDDENVPAFVDLPPEQQLIYIEALLRCGYDLTVLGIRAIAYADVVNAEQKSLTVKRL